MDNKLINIEKLKLKYHHHKSLVTENLIEMGNTLIELKESMEHGQWTDFIKNESDISMSTAQKYMKIAKELGEKTELVTHLGIKKSYKLLSIPAEKRDSFLESNNVLDLSYNQLCELIEGTKTEPVTHLESKENEILRRMQAKMNKLELSDDFIKKLDEMDDLSLKELEEKTKEYIIQLATGALSMDICILKAKINNWKLSDEAYESYEELNYMYPIEERKYSLEELEAILRNDDTDKLNKLKEKILNQYKK